MSVLACIYVYQYVPPMSYFFLYFFFITDNMDPNEFNAHVERDAVKASTVFKREFTEYSGKGLIKVLLKCG